jgi:glycerophosphoryl diester phosphodiesterase
VPALADVLAALPRRAFLDVELKVVAGLETIEVLAGGRGRDLERAVISSFEPAALRHVAQLAPAWPRWLNVPWIDDAILDAARDLDVQGLSVEWHAITPQSAARVRAAGLDLAAWTVRRRDTFTRLGTLGVAAICVEGAALDG